MKNALLVLLFLSFGFTGSAQNYISFPDSNALWLVRHGVGDTFPEFHYYGLKNEDTVINTVTYHKLFRSSDTVFNNSDYVGGLRQDLNTKRVYYYGNTSATERVLYDFSLNAGDTITNIVNNGTQAVVYSIDSISIGGIFHRQINFRLYSSSSAWPFGSWVEGVGNIDLGGLLGSPTLQPTCDCADNLVCFKENDTWIYHNVGYSFIDCSAPPLGIEEHQSHEGTCLLYPNPISGTSYLHLNRTGFAKLDIYNMNGHLVSSNAIGKDVKDVRLDKKDYVAGYYYYRLYDSAGRTLTGKFVVE